MRNVQKLYRQHEVIGEREKCIIRLLPISKAAFYRGIVAGKYIRTLQS